MIEKRAKTFVTSNGLVPVDSVCDSIGSGYGMEKILRVFPIDVHDVVDCINFYAENTTIPNTDDETLLDLINVGDDDGEVVIEITRLHQIVYMKLLALSLKYYPKYQNFSTMINQALRICCLTIVDKLDSGEEIDNKLELLVQSALYRHIPGVLIDRERTRSDLDYIEFIELKNSGKN